MFLGGGSFVIGPRLFVLVSFSFLAFFAHGAKRTLPEIFACDMLLDVPDRLGPDVRGFFVPVHVPYDGVEATPVWHSGSSFERAFLMSTELVRPYMFPDITPDVLYGLERAARHGRRGPRLRIEFPGGRAQWSHVLEPDRDFETAMAPEGVKNYLENHYPRGWRLISRLSLFFWKPFGTPPTLNELAEARGALLIAKRHFGLGRDVTLEVHGIGPLPERPQFYVDFNIDLSRRPQDARRERAGPKLY